MRKPTDEDIRKLREHVEASRKRLEADKKAHAVKVELHAARSLRQLVLDLIRDDSTDEDILRAYRLLRRYWT